MARIGYGVDDDADRFASDIHYHDSSFFGRCLLEHAEPQPQVYYGNDCTTKIDQAFDIFA